MKHTTILKSAAEVALHRTAAQWKAAKHAQRLADWASRLEPASYRCHREGDDWIAEGPCGQRFEYSKTERDDVLVLSHSGGIYLIEPCEDGFRCDCEAWKRNEHCKHMAAWEAIRAEHAARRAGVKAALAAEAAAMNAERDGDYYYEEEGPDPYCSQCQVEPVKEWGEFCEGCCEPDISEIPTCYVPGYGWMVI